MELNQATTMDNLWGGYFEGVLTTGTADVIYGSESIADMDGGTASLWAVGARNQVVVDGSTIATVYGTNIFVDLNSGTVSGNAYGLYVAVDDDLGVTGSVTMIYMEENTGIDYGIYQNGSAENLFGGVVNASAESIRVKQVVHNVTNPPTAAELTAAFGAAPAVLGDGFLGLVDDSDSANMYSCVIISGAWYWGQVQACV